MKDHPIHYEPHPVSPERKAELRAQGYRILDAVYAPPGHQPVDSTLEPAQDELKPARKGRKPAKNTED